MKQKYSESTRFKIFAAGIIVMLVAVYVTFSDPTAWLKGILGLLIFGLGGAYMWIIRVEERVATIEKKAEKG